MTIYMQHRQALKNGFIIPVAKVKPPIAKVSEKRKVDKKEYVKIVAEMLKENPNCEIKEDGCQTKATGLHHQKKRSPDTYLDKRFLKRACDSCNSWAELYPLEAIAKGHSISKFKPVVLVDEVNDTRVVVIDQI